MELQCIVLTQHHDYVQGMKAGRRKKAAAGADICDWGARRSLTDGMFACSFPAQEGKRGGEAIRL